MDNLHTASAVPPSQDLHCTRPFSGQPVLQLGQPLQRSVACLGEPESKNRVSAAKLVTEGAPHSSSAHLFPRAFSECVGAGGTPSG